jgi:hypothetical protein
MQTYFIGFESVVPHFLAATSAYPSSSVALCYVFRCDMFNKPCFNLCRWEFDDRFLKAIRSDSPKQLDQFMCEESEYLYSFPLLKPEFCNKIVEEIDHFEKWSEQHGLQVNRPNSMNNYGAILDDFGMEVRSICFHRVQGT